MNINEAYDRLNQAFTEFSDSCMYYINKNPNNPRSEELIAYVSSLQSELGEWLLLLEKWGDDETWFKGGNFIKPN